MLELKEQNKELEMALEKVKTRNRELSEIAYQTSHDMRGPATTLQGLSNLISIENDPALVQSFMEEVPVLLAKVDAFSKSLSDYTTTINRPIEHLEINWEEIFNKAIQQISAREAVQLKITAHEVFYSDPQRLITMLKHLVTNAYNFNQHLLPDLKIEVIIEMSANEAIIEVKDNGIGIAEDRLEKIFDMFYRGSLESKGSGLGLYLVKAVVEDLSGKITVSNNSNDKGASFNVKIPPTKRPVKLPSFDF